MKRELVSLIYLILFMILLIGFFFPIFVGKIPLPTDALVGLYHPYRDFYSDDFPRGIPFKNFLVTDPVLQQYPYRYLALELARKGELPLWNPYSFSGTPLLGTLQGSVFYPLNLFLFLLPFSAGWTFLIIAQPLFAGIFLFLYLKNLKQDSRAAILGSFTFAFSGFFVSWLEWGTVIHVALWLPLILLSIDKLFEHFKQISNSKYQIANIYIKNKKFLLWFLILLTSSASAFFAGHLQTFFYLSLLSFVYFIFRWVEHGRIFTILYVFLLFTILFLILTAVQWIPTLQFIQHSARDIDQIATQSPGWFIPWQHLIQFLAPDFFGNPTTLNYWGVWNYAELVGYVGVAPLILAITALFYRRDKKTFFFGTLFFLSLIFSLPTIFAKIPYLLHIPFIQTARPTRLLFLIDFSLSVLATFGLQFLLKEKQKILPVFLFFVLLFSLLWIVVLFGAGIFHLSTENVQIARRNLILPTMLFLASLVTIFLLITFSNTYKRLILILLLCIVSFDLLRFAHKFLPFAKQTYLYPKTKILSYLEQQKGQFRIMATNREILPPNVSIMYRLQSIEGYDPLYLRRYAELIAALERGEASIKPPFGFNRIITPHRIHSRIADLLGAKYILTFDDLKNQNYHLVMQEGKTKLYENKNAYPRAFFVENLIPVENKEQAIRMLFDPNIRLHETAVVEEYTRDVYYFSIGAVRIKSYSPNKIVIETDNPSEGFLVLTDTFYPLWHVTIDNIPNKKHETTIYRTNYAFRGITVPPGRHNITFSISLW